MDKRKPSEVFLELWRARGLQTSEAFRECAEAWAEIRRMEDQAGKSTPKSTRKSTPETAAKSTPESAESTPAEEVQNGPDPVRSKAGAEYTSAETKRAYAYRKANRDKHYLVGAALRRWREEQGLTQTQFAQKIGISQPAVSLWEAGSVPIDFAKLDQAYPMALKNLEATAT